MNIFKDNPKLSIYYIIWALSAVIIAKPDLISFIPDTYEAYVKGVAGLIAAVSTIIGFTSTPNKKQDDNNTKN